MKKFKAFLAGVLSMTLLLPALSGLSVAAEKDADALVYAPTASQWYIPEVPEGVTTTVTDAPDGGTHVEFSTGSEDITFVTNKQTLISTKQKVKWDGLHIRIENHGVYGVALHLSDKQETRHSPAVGGASGTMCINVPSSGDVSFFDGAWMNNDHLFNNPDDRPDLSGTIDIKFKKTEEGHMMVTVNGQGDDLITSKSALEMAAFPDEVYVSFINGFNEMPHMKFDVTVLHGGESECLEGEKLEMEDHDAELNPPSLQEDTFKASSDGKFTVTAGENGGLHFAAEGVGFGDTLTSEKTYAFNGLHFRLENLELSSNYVNVWFSGSETHKWTFGDIANVQGYYLNINMGNGQMRCLSNLIGACGGNSYSEVAGGSAIQNAESLDIRLGIMDGKNLSTGEMEPCYGFIVNGVFLPVTEVSTVNTWKAGAVPNINFENVYIGFDGSDANDAAGNKSFSFDMTVLHGGDETCYAEMPAVLLEKVKELEKALEELAAIETVTLEDEAKITAARNLYNSLTDMQKELLNDTNLPALEKAENALKALKEQQSQKDQEAVQKVVELIDAIPETVTLADEAKIAAAEVAYAALTDVQKSEVTNFMDLTFARMALDVLKEDAGSEPDVPTDPVETGASTLPVVVCAVLVVLATGMLVVSKRKAHA